MNKLFIMKLSLDFFIALSCIICLASSKETYRYEKQNFFGMGSRVFQKPKRIVLRMDNQAEYPQPLPTQPSKNIIPIPSPYKTLYQGVRGRNDTRVFRRRFEYEAKLKGHQVLCEGLFDCIITFLAVESTEAIPIILRGGAGYRHFSAVIKAKPGRELKGQVRAYCKRPPEEPMIRSWKKKSFKFQDRHSSSE